MPATAHRWTALALSAAFLTLLAIPGVYHLRYGFGKADAARYAQILRTDPPAAAIKKFEADFDQRFLPAQAARTLLAGVPVTALQPRSPDTTRAPDGNIFYSVDLEVPRSAGFLDRTFGRGRGVAAALADLSRQLAARDIHLLVVPVPAKSSLYPDSLRPGYDASAGPDLNPQHAEWIALLRSSGVDTLDLTPLLWTLRHDRAAGPAYQRDDSHWSPNTVAKAADAIADHLRPRLAGLPTVPFVARLKAIRRQGDLALMDETPVPNMRETITQILRSPPTSPSDFLNPGNEAPVLLIGDSFAAFYANLGTALHHQLTRALSGIPVQSAATIGAKADQIREPLVTTPELLTHKRIVVLAYSIRLNICCEWRAFPIAPPAPLAPTQPK